MLSVGSISENLPDLGSYGELDPAQRHSFGQPKARIDAHLGDMAIERLRSMAQTSRRTLETTGAEKLIEECGAYGNFNATHVFGPAAWTQTLRHRWSTPTAGLIAGAIRWWWPLASF